MTITDVVTPPEATEPSAEPDAPNSSLADTSRIHEPELLRVDPHELVLEDDVRGQKPLDRQFLASVRDLGVLVPVSARRGEDGGLRVLLGQQRTRAAREVGLASIPVYVIEAPDEEKAAQIGRIIEQLAENDHRAALPDADRVAAHQQLSLLGLSASVIARRTHVPAKAVKASLAVAGSEVASAVLRRYELTVDEAAVIAELGGSESEVDREAVTALTVAAREQPDQVEHVAQRIRDARAATAAREAAVEQLTAANVRVRQLGTLTTRGPRRPGRQRAHPGGAPSP